MPSLLRYGVKKKYLTPQDGIGTIVQVKTMDDKIRQGDLYDFYGPLLNQHQKKIYEDFVLEDLSLQEVADLNGTSRQAVHDLIKRCTKDMEAKEEALHLIERFRKVREEVSRLSAAVSDKLSDSDAKKFDEIISHILEEL